VTDAPADIPPPPRPVEYEGMDRSTGTWLLVAGAALVLLGLYLLANPFAAIWILGVVIGISLALGGVAEVLAGRNTSGPRWPSLVLGLVFVGLGIASMAWPDATVWVIALLAGLALVAGGLISLGASLGGGEGMGLRLGLGAASLIAGIVVLAWPDATLLVVAIIIGLRTLLAGALFIAMGWNVRRLA
jgi:uncharacterized membrane protein HdeD (DUF308 family)